MMREIRFSCDTYVVVAKVKSALGLKRGGSARLPDAALPVVFELRTLEKACGRQL